MADVLPVLITAFLRVEKTLTLLERLALLGVKNIYISIDKGRDARECELQRLFLKRIKDFSEKYQIDLKIRVQTKNQGLAVSVIAAVDWLFESEDFGVILEDDLDPSHEFLVFCSENKKYLDSSSPCLLISGNSFNESNDILYPSYIAYPLIWGWATTRQKWQIMKDEITIKNYFSWRALLSPSKIGFFLTGLIRARKGSIDSWAVPLAARMYFGQYTCLIPPTNLVANSGDDEISTHSNSNDWTLNHPIRISKNALYSAQTSRFSSVHNKFVEKSIYGIRWYHVFSPMKSYFFDRYRKTKPQTPLLDRLRESN
jgi:hypothetical protein